MVVAGSLAHPSTADLRYRHQPYRCARGRVLHRSVRHCPAVLATPNRIGADIVPSGVYTRKAPLERFMAFVEKTADGHWLWTGGTSEGYGTFWNNGKVLAAHVFSYEEFIGPVPEGHQIRHKCDIHPCVATEHLTTGTAKDNAADREERGRHAHLPTTNKLSDEQAAELRQKYGSRRKFDRPSLAEIGQQYGISASSVCWLLKGRTYRKELMPHGR